MSKLQINYNNVPDTLQLKEKEVQNQFLKPYTMFRYSVRSEVTRKYYERRLRKFFDFIEFEVGVEDVERRYNDFAEKGKSNINTTLNQIIRFLHFQKEKYKIEFLIRFRVFFAILDVITNSLSLVLS